MDFESLKQSQSNLIRSQIRRLKLKKRDHLVVNQTNIKMTGCGNLN